MNQIDEMGRTYRVTLVLLVCSIVGGRTDATAQTPRLLVLEDPPVAWAEGITERTPVVVQLEALKDQPTRVQLERVRRLLEGMRDGQPPPAGATANLLAALGRSEAVGELRRTLISVLIELDARDHADLLWQAAREDLVVSRAVEAALIRWESDAALEEWRQRLIRGEARPEAITRALRGVGRCGTAEDAALAEEWLNRSALPEVVLAAADALARLRPRGNLTLARRLHEAGERRIPFDSRYLSTLLVENDPGEAAREWLEQLASSSSATVGEETASRLRATPTSGPADRVILLSLNRNHPQAARSLAARWMEHRDSPVRRTSIEILAVDPTPTEIERLALAMDDPHPRLRRLARRSLIEAAADQVNRQPVIERLLAALRGDRWRSIEQAILGLTQLEQRKIIPDLFERLDHERGDVSVTAAWGLQRLIEDRDDVTRVAERLDRWVGLSDVVDPQRETMHTAHRVAHLIEVLGKHRHRESDDTLRRCVPKGSGFHSVIRASAIWALGKIWEGESPPGLRELLRRRLLDRDPQRPEQPLVKYAAAIALGRLGDPASLDDLLNYLYEDPDAFVIPGGAQWSIERIENRSPSERLGVPPLQ